MPELLGKTIASGNDGTVGNGSDGVADNGSDGAADNGSDGVADNGSLTANASANANFVFLNISSRELISFYRDPLMHLLSSRLKIDLRTGEFYEQSLVDEFPSDALLAYKIREVIFNHLRDNPSSNSLSPGQIKKDIRRYIFGSGQLLDSHCHDSFFEENFQRAHNFALSVIIIDGVSSTVADFATKLVPNYLDFSLPPNNCAQIFNLQDYWGNTFENNLILIRFGRRRFLDVIKTIIFHLATNSSQVLPSVNQPRNKTAQVATKKTVEVSRQATAQVDDGNGTYFIYEDTKAPLPGTVKVDFLHPLSQDRAQELLVQILEWYVAGIQKPLPFIPLDKSFDAMFRLLAKNKPVVKGSISFEVPDEEYITLCLGDKALSECDEIYDITLWFANLYNVLLTGIGI